MAFGWDVPPGSFSLFYEEKSSAAIAAIAALFDKACHGSADKDDVLSVLSLQLFGEVYEHTLAALFAGI